MDAPWRWRHSALDEPPRATPAVEAERDATPEHYRSSIGMWSTCWCYLKMSRGNRYLKVSSPMGTFTMSQKELPRPLDEPEEILPVTLVS